MRGIALVLAAWLWAGAALAQVAPPSPPTRVEVVRDGDRWTAEFRFGRLAPAWAFTHSALTRVGEHSWRLPTWTIETPGVRLERRGWYDVLVADGGKPVPGTVRVRFTPAPDDLLADYDSALTFTDGAVALFSDQFDLIPLASAAAADTLPSDLNEARIEDIGTRALFRDTAGPVLVGGERKAVADLSNGQTYVLFGGAKVTEGGAVSTILDPELPAWLAGDLAASTARMLSFYTQRLGTPAGRKPMLMVSWEGPTKGLRSMGGSVLPGLVLMTFEGEVMTRPDREVLDSASWFVGHEAAHFWLGQTVRYQYSRDAWITEGGADLLAWRASQAIDPQFDAKPMLQAWVTDCAKLAASGPVSTSADRNQHRANHACGAVFGLVAEAAARKGGSDFFGFVRGLIDANREDKVVTGAEWLGELTRVSGDSSLARDIALLVDTKVADPSALIASLLGRSGIVATVGADGKLVVS